MLKLLFTQLGTSVCPFQIGNKTNSSAGSELLAVKSNIGNRHEIRIDWDGWDTLYACLAVYCSPRQIKIKRWVEVVSQWKRQKRYETVQGSRFAHVRPVRVPGCSPRNPSRRGLGTIDDMVGVFNDVLVFEIVSRLSSFFIVRPTFYGCKNSTELNFSKMGFPIELNNWIIRRLSEDRTRHVRMK